LISGIEPTRAASRSGRIATGCSNLYRRSKNASS